MNAPLAEPCLPTRPWLGALARVPELREERIRAHVIATTHQEIQVAERTEAWLLVHGVGEGRALQDREAYPRVVERIGKAEEFLLGEQAPGHRCRMEF